MLYNLIQLRKGKEIVVMTDNLPKVNQRMKTLRSSQRRGIKKQKVEYKIQLADDTQEKYKQSPHNLNLAGERSQPKRIR